MTRETVVDKANRLLTAGAVWIETVAHDLVRARVTGDHDTYVVTRDHRGWRCSCPARRGHCAHLTAVRLVCEEGPANHPGAMPHAIYSATA